MTGTFHKGRCEDYRSCPHQSMINANGKNQDNIFCHIPRRGRKLSFNIPFRVFVIPSTTQPPACLILAGCPGASFVIHHAYVFFWGLTESKSH
jgi:hypothetical protein